MNEYLLWELARMHRAEQLQKAEHARHARAAASKHATRRLPWQVGLRHNHTSKEIQR
jgi:hypothetical protein